MARHHMEEGNNDWMYWVLGIGAAWYLYSSGFFTTLMNSFGTMLPRVLVLLLIVKGKCQQFHNRGLLKLSQRRFTVMM